MSPRRRACLRQASVQPLHARGWVSVLKVDTVVAQSVREVEEALRDLGVPAPLREMAYALEEWGIHRVLPRSTARRGEWMTIQDFYFRQDHLRIASPDSPKALPTPMVSSPTSVWTLRLSPSGGLSTCRRETPTHQLSPRTLMVALAPSPTMWSDLPLRCDVPHQGPRLEILAATPPNTFSLVPSSQVAPRSSPPGGRQRRSKEV
mmetsp:Transcript_10992/g.25106  ORF Transcript_10992/g.25106 Transcript_10992/m.25106 type:complete len:205 (+) Transcript_10992:457-1071(+)